MESRVEKNKSVKKSGPPVQPRPEVEKPVKTTEQKGKKGAPPVHPLSEVEKGAPPVHPLPEVEKAVETTEQKGVKPAEEDSNDVKATKEKLVVHGRILHKECECGKAVDVDAGTGQVFVSVKEVSLKEEKENRIFTKFAELYYIENEDMLLHRTPQKSSINGSKASSSSSSSSSSTTADVETQTKLRSLSISTPPSAQNKASRLMQSLKVEIPTERAFLVDALVAHHKMFLTYRSWLNNKSLENAGMVLKDSELNQEVGVLMLKISHLVVCQTVENFKADKGLSTDQVFCDGGKTLQIPFSRSFFYEAKNLFALCCLPNLDYRVLLFRTVKPSNVSALYKSEKQDMAFSKTMAARYRELGWTVDSEETWEDFLEKLLDEADQIISEL
jgi:hypothetical protein